MIEGRFSSILSHFPDQHHHHYYDEEIIDTEREIKLEELPCNENDWWFKSRDRLLELAKENNTPLYVYDKATLLHSVDDLKRLTAVDRLYFAIKANSNDSILRLFETLGVNFECVSKGEIDYMLSLFPDIERTRILFTPNFAPKSEYEYGFSKGVFVTIDCIYPLQKWGDIFKEKEFLVRIDPGHGDGHHKHVRTAGIQSKFGVSLGDVPLLANLVNSLCAKVIGLHCHVGSGIRDTETWSNAANTLIGVQHLFPHLKYLDVGGGLGIVENKSTELHVQLDEVNDRLQEFKKHHPDLEIWMEPGRYFVATAGVLLGSVTQVKHKGGGVHYIGIDAGFNSLIRPILYDAYHQIVNLTKLNSEGPFIFADIVGFICETGDVFGKHRPMPADTDENDIVLIATAGAYGRSMSSNYNMREPAREYFLE